MPRHRNDADGAGCLAMEIPMTRAKITGLLLGVLAIASAGCQGKPPFAPVEGTVTQGGKPLAGVIVDFYPDPGTLGPRSTSTPTDEAGHYRLRSSWGGQDGAVMGPHRVCILDAHERGRNSFGRLPKKAANSKEAPKEEMLRKQAAPRVPPSYSHPNETPLRVEVHSGPQVIDFDVKSTDVQVMLIGVPGK
jgi:hypothetical protein